MQMIMENTKTGIEMIRNTKKEMIGKHKETYDRDDRKTQKR